MNTPVQAPSKAKPRGGWKSLAIIMVTVLGSSQAWQWWRGEQAAKLVQQHASAAEITLYTTSTCPYCAKARAWLTRHAVPWRECNVEQDAQCMAQYASRGAPGVPLVHAKGQWRLGFDPTWLGQVLREADQAALPSSSSPRRDKAPLP